MARQKVATKRVALFLPVEAAELLPQLAPSENKQGQYVGELIIRAARERGLLAEEAEPEGNGEVAELRRQIAALQTQVNKIARQRGQHQPAGESDSDSPSL